MTNTYLTPAETDRLTAELYKDRKVFYPAKLLERFIAEPYSVWFLQNERRHDEAQTYTVKVMRESRILSRRLIMDLDYHVALVAFEAAKERAITNVGCEALGIPPLPTP